MGFAEFEEKEFEGALYNQLANGLCNVWTPGQCLEKYIGFDYSGDIRSHDFWKRFGVDMPNGVVLDHCNLDFLWDKKSNIRPLPNFNLNLFIQAKRPYVYTGRRKDSVYKYKHYSFKINMKQQKILEQLNAKLNKEALMVYAAPAFGTRNELYSHIKDRDIISYTSFPKVDSLCNHTRWYYYDAYNGIAHSEPEEKKTYNIFNLIDEFRKKSNDSNGGEFRKNIYKLSITIENVLHEFEKEIQVQFFFWQMQEIKKQLKSQDIRIKEIDYRTSISLLTITSFCNIFNFNWFVL